MFSCVEGLNLWCLSQSNLVLSAKQDKFLQSGDDTVFYEQRFCSNMLSPLGNMALTCQQ